MKTVLQNFSAELVKRVLHFLWRQWGQIGLASVSVEPRDGWAVDPEALWLLSATYARHDPRLLDEIMDWLSTNASFVNIPRLKSLMRRFEFVGQPVIAAMAAAIKQQNRSLKWGFVPSRGPGQSEGLFLDSHGLPLPDYGVSDPGFLEFGFRRGKLELRGLSRRFNAVMPECALLRLRALFGVTARADAMLYLLTHDAAHPSGIARETGFSQKNVQDLLVDMAASQIVGTAQFGGRMKHYFVQKDDRIRFLHSPDNLSLTPRWVTWPPLFRLLEILLIEARRLGSLELSDQLLASELREVMARIRPLAHQAGMAGGLSDGVRFPGAGYAAVFIDEMNKWLAAALREGANNATQSRMPVSILNATRQHPNPSGGIRSAGSGRGRRPG